MEPRGVCWLFEVQGSVCDLRLPVTARGVPALFLLLGVSYLRANGIQTC